MSELDNIFVAVFAFIIAAIIVAIAIAMMGATTLFFINWFFNVELAFTVTNIIYAAAVASFGDIALKLFGAMIKGLVK